eukprot:TRINITY_DN21921_c0_g1_i1.p1 TRINITY_DN21921_c0_g1~~TRINITY_DN21921_c0_g1_i1.p1  ORF type:complete len:254 (+),score=95.84 TRINITY_DN21921_c0_g1_i1:160-921(+)
MCIRDSASNSSSTKRPDGSTCLPSVALREVLTSVADILNHLAGDSPGFAHISGRFDRLGQLTYDLQKEIAQLRRPPELEAEVHGLEIQLHKAGQRLQAQTASLATLQHTLGEVVAVERQLCDSAAELEARHWTATDTLHATTRKCDELQRGQQRCEGVEEVKQLASELQGLLTLAPASESPDSPAQQQKQQLLAELESVRAKAEEQEAQLQQCELHARELLEAQHRSEARLQLLEKWVVGDATATELFDKESR